MHRFDLGYMLGQLRGAIIGTLLVVLVWERHAASVGVFSLHHVCHPMDS
jgi:glycerol uptake facilitator-like aquaporin